MNISTIHKFLATHTLSLKICVKLRNQMNCVIQNYVANGCDMKFNGEFFIIEHLINNCNSFVDVGANAGEWTDHIVRIQKDITSFHIFEPQYNLYENLCRKFALPNFYIHSEPLSNKIGDVNFKIEGRSSRINNNRVSSSNIIKSNRLDNIIQDPIDYVKIDCEGHDLQVILGAEKLISKGYIKFITFEYNDLWLENSTSLSGCISFLKCYDFKVYRISQDSIVDFEYELLGDFYRYSNFIAIHNNYLHLVKEIISKDIY